MAKYINPKTHQAAIDAINELQQGWNFWAPIYFSTGIAIGAGLVGAVWYMVGV